MKILQATIYGFGKWVDYEIDFSQSPFITIFGHNESGKTTLQRFLHFMLFGLPPKQRKFFQPKDSSKMGGKLFILDSEIGEYSIERIGDASNGAARCYTADGKEYDEAWLRERLRGIDEKTYRAIFSFSAMDLNKLQDVKEEEISEVLLGIGLTGSTRIYSVEKRLEQQISEYFKPYGKNPMINQQLQTLERLQREIKELKAEEAEYREKLNLIHVKKEEIALLEKTIKEANEKLFQLEKLVQALPQIEEYVELQSRLEELPKGISFPEDGMERLESLKRELIPIESEINLAIKNKELYTEEMETLVAKNSSFPFKEAKVITAQASDYQDMEKERSAIQEQIDKLHNEIRTKLSDLQIGLDLAQLTKLHFPFHQENDWINLIQSIDTIEREIKLAKENKQLQQAKMNRISEELSVIESRQLTVERIRELEEILEVHKENQLLEYIQKDQSDRQKKWKKTKELRRKRMNGILLGSILIGVLLATFSIFIDQIWLVNLSVLSLFIGYLQWFFGKKSIQNMDKYFDHTPSNSLTTITAEERKNAEKLLAQHQEMQRAKELLQDKLLDIEIQLQQLTEKQFVIESQYDELLEQIAHEKMKYSFLENVDVHYWPELCQTLKGFLDQLQRTEELHSKAIAYTQKIEAYYTMLDTYLEEHFPSLHFRSYISKLEFLENEVSAYQNREQQINQITKILQDLENQVRENTITLELVEDRIRALFVQAHAKDEEEFYKRYSEVKEKKELLESCRRIATQFSSYFTPDEWNHLIDNAPSRSKVELEIMDINQLVKRKNSELEQKRQQLANITVEIRNLETSQSYSYKLHQFQMEKEKLCKLVRKWAVFKTAKELLSETKHQYRDKYLSRVIEKTTHYLRIITDNRYVQVFSPTAESPFMLEREDHIRFSVQELSQGTINQLYTSLRLAISEVMSDQFHLPFMIDDAFVHFDVIRNKRILQILEEFSKNHQVLLFTCKQDLLEDLPNKNLLHLTNHVPLVEN